MHTLLVFHCTIQQPAKQFKALLVVVLCVAKAVSFLESSTILLLKQPSTYFIELFMSV